MKEDSRVARESENACFETGIKMGALYHQFIGTPFSSDSVGSLETSIEDSIGSQRYASEVNVEIRNVDYNRFGYAELQGNMLDIELVVEYGDTRVEASMSEEDGYPMMRIDSVTP